jgi:hypothetical protein
VAAFLTWLSTPPFHQGWLFIGWPTGSLSSPAVWSYSWLLQGSPEQAMPKQRHRKEGTAVKRQQQS